MAYLEDPLPSTRPGPGVGEGHGHRQPTRGEPFTKSPKIPPALTKAVTAAGGEVVETDAASRNMSRLGGRAVRRRPASTSSPAVRDRIVKTIGEDGGAVVGIIERLKGAFAPGTRLRLDDVEPFLGPAGGVPAVGPHRRHRHAATCRSPSTGSSG